MLFESKFPALIIKVLVRTIPPVVSSSDWHHFFSWEPVSADLNFRVSERTGLMCMRVGFNPVKISAKSSHVCQLGPYLSLCYRSYSLSRTLSYCSPAFDYKIRIYLSPNLSFAALFHIKYDSCDNLVWHT